jgi:ABC-type polysaccharide/polyol phosphate export permease
VTRLGANWDLLRLLVVREVRVRYARTLLGVAWAVFQPLVMLAVFTALNFGSFIEAGSRWIDVPYAVFAFCGLVFWLHFQQSLVGGTSVLVISRDMLHKSRFPAELLPLSRVLAALLDLGIGAALLLVLMVGHGMELHATALLVPLVFLLQLALTVGCVLILAAVNLFFRDVQYLLGVAVMLLMFASNVVWPLDRVTGRAGELLALNPIVSLLDAYRSLLFLGQIPTLNSLLPGIVGGVVALAVGLAYFRRVAPRFPEEV